MFGGHLIGIIRFFTQLSEEIFLVREQWNE